MMAQELQLEGQKTRMLMELVPEEHWDWKPHPKSYTLGQLTTHLGHLLSWGGHTLRREELDLNPPGQEPLKGPRYDSLADALGLFDTNLQDCLEAFKESKDEDLNKTWTLLSGGHTILAMPRGAILRSFVISHMIHHRAQLGVYLRLKDVPLPPIYGPTADERAM
ncbi:MAG: DinB family protein [Calditrichaeota bacterium]|nr:DinB family protein [Calditrichota bacterium]